MTEGSRTLGRTATGDERVPWGRGATAVEAAAPPPGGGDPTVRGRP
jgi:hypothetical protein